MNFYALNEMPLNELSGVVVIDTGVTAIATATASVTGVYVGPSLTGVTRATAHVEQVVLGDIAIPTDYALSRMTAEVGSILIEGEPYIGPVIPPLVVENNVASASAVAGYESVTLGRLSLTSSRPVTDATALVGSVLLATLNLTKVAIAKAVFSGEVILSSQTVEATGPAVATSSSQIGPIYLGHIQSGYDGDATTSATASNSIPLLGSVTVEGIASASAVGIASTLGLSGLTVLNALAAASSSASGDVVYGALNLTEVASASAVGNGAVEVFTLIHTYIIGEVASANAVATGTILSSTLAFGATPISSATSADFDEVILATVTLQATASSSAVAVNDLRYLDYLHSELVGSRPWLYQLWLNSSEYKQVDTDGTESFVTNAPIWKKYLTTEHVTLLGSALLRVENSLNVMALKSNALVNLTAGTPSDTLEETLDYPAINDALASLVQAHNNAHQDILALADFLTGLQVHLISLSDRLGISPPLSDKDRAYLDSINARNDRVRSIYAGESPCFK